mgnify:CR=1 FL=1
MPVSPSAAAVGPIDGGAGSDTLFGGPGDDDLALVVLAFQVCAIYMSGALYKAGGAAWQHGFAVYR